MVTPGWNLVMEAVASWERSSMNSARTKSKVLAVVATLLACACACVPGTAFAGHEAMAGGHGSSPPRGGGHSAVTTHTGSAHTGRYREAGHRGGVAYAGGHSNGARLYLGSTALWTPCTSVSAPVVAPGTPESLTGTCGPHWGTGYWVWSDTGWVEHPGIWWVSPTYPGWVWMGEPGVWDGKGWASRDGYWTMLDGAQAGAAKGSSGARPDA